MGRSRIVRAVQIVIIIVSLAGGRAVRAEVAIGASFGYTHLSYPGTPQFKNEVVGLPGASSWGQPGLRIGFSAPGGRWDLIVDAGLVNVHRSGTIGADKMTAEVLPQVQFDARGWGGFGPFVNAGVGFVHENVFTTYGSSAAETRPEYGGGIGVRRSVSDGHGFIRAELRYDHLPERVASLGSWDSFTFPATDMVSVKLGFDLLVAR